LKQAAGKIVILTLNAVKGKNPRISPDVTIAASAEAKGL
jgi:hypothetical protein